MSKYQTLTKFLNTQNQYIVEGLSGQHENIRDLGETPNFRVVHISDIRDVRRIRVKDPRRRGHLDESLSEQEIRLNRDIDTLEQWIEEGTGLKPTKKIYFSDQGGMSKLPRLVFAEPLLEGTITANFTSAEGKKESISYKPHVWVNIHIDAQL